MWGAIIGAVVALISTLVTSNQQETANQHAAQWQYDAQQKLIRDQNAYNTPVEQIKRFQEAGLNPNLIYGQGNPGNQSTSGTAPSMIPKDFGSINQALQKAGGLGGDILQNELTRSQINAVNASTRQRNAQVQVNELQARVLAANPLLDEEGFKATIQSLKAAAELKGEDTKLRRTQADVADKASGHVVAKIFAEVQNLEQKFRLAQLDEKLKAEVLKSKEFQNAILEVQKKFMADGEVGANQIYQFITLLLTKIL